MKLLLEKQTFPGKLLVLLARCIWILERGFTQLLNCVSVSTCISCQAYASQTRACCFRRQELGGLSHQILYKYSRLKSLMGTSRCILESHRFPHPSPTKLPAPAQPHLLSLTKQCFFFFSAKHLSYQKAVTLLELPDSYRSANNISVCAAASPIQDREDAPQKDSWISYSHCFQRSLRMSICMWGSIRSVLILILCLPAP